MVTSALLTAGRMFDMARKEKAENPQKRRVMRQVWQAYKITIKEDPISNLWIILGFVGTLAVAVLASVLISSNWIFGLLLGLPTALLVAMFILVRRWEPVMFRQIEDQPGAAGATINTLGRGWRVNEEPVAIDARTQDMIFRVVGRPGVVLISEGPPGRAKRMLDKEAKRVNALVKDVPVHTIQTGKGEGQVELRRVTRKITRLRPKLSRAEVDVVTKRLDSVAKLRMPMPKGFDPSKARIDRKGMRGR